MANNGRTAAKARSAQVLRNSPRAMPLIGFTNFGESAWMFSSLRCEAVLLATMKPYYCKRLTQKAQFVRQKAVFHGQNPFCETTIIRNNSRAYKRRRCFTDEIHSVRQRLSGIADGPQIMRCVTKNGTSQNWIDSNNLHVVILCIFLSVKDI